MLHNSKEKKNVNALMRDFAEMCRDSKNYQGDGWGVLYKGGEELHLHRSLNPIWEDEFELPETEFALVHARFAHGDWTKGDINNNQPFCAQDSVFVFNGNLKRVDIDVPGKIGAEKVMNLVLQKGIAEAVAEMCDKAALVKAINFLLIQGETCHVNCYYTIDPEYFDLRISEGDDEIMIVSYDLPGRNFERIKSGEIREIKLYQNITSLPIKS